LRKRTCFARGPALALELPLLVTHAQLWFLNTLVTPRGSSEEGSDGLSLLENLAPRDDSPPLHVHHTDDELFHILEGEPRFRVGDEELRLAAGETLLAPKGVPDTYLVESERGRWLVATAHGDFERSGPEGAALLLRGLLFRLAGVGDVRRGGDGPDRAAS
jgi:mannose-6-phosphate isomerase-like protein (cupin superfamily)